MLYFKQNLISAAVFMFGLIPSLLGQTAGPVLFYSDLTDGPRTGGENNLGAYVCVYGRNFGSTRGSSTITIGGTPVTNYIIWGDGNAIARGDSKACFQPGNSVPTGAQSIQMTVGGFPSNTLPFYVRADTSDAIYCVSDVGLPLGTGTAPSDSNDGHFGTTHGHGCWATFPHFVNPGLAGPAHAGAIMYLHNINYAPTSGIAYESAATTSTSSGPNGGNDAQHMSVLASYPGSPSTLGSLNYSANIEGVEILMGNYTIANLILRGSYAAFTITGAGGYDTVHLGGFMTNWRFVGNDSSCSNGGSTGCIVTTFDNGGTFYGNLTHDIDLMTPHGYMTGAIPGGGPLDSQDSILVSVVSDGMYQTSGGAKPSNCTANVSGSLGSSLYVGENDIGWAGGPPPANTSLAYIAAGSAPVTSIGTNSFVFQCLQTAAGTYDASNYPAIWYNARQKLFHSTYFGINSTNYNVGWNEWANNWSNNDVDSNSTPLNAANPNNPTATGTWGVGEPNLSGGQAFAGHPILGTTTGCVSGGCTGARTLYVSMSWTDGMSHESDASHETAISLSANQLLTVTAPAFTVGGQDTPGYLAVSSCTVLGSCHPAQWCVYAGTSPGAGTNQGCFKSGVNYTEPSTSITTSGSVRLNMMTQNIGQIAGYPATHVFIHDNLIHGGATTGIDTNDWSPTPSNLYGDSSTGGGVYIYNNVIYRQAKGLYINGTPPITSFGPTQNGNAACIQVIGATQNGPTFTGKMYIENNTCYDVGDYMYAGAPTIIAGFISVGQEPWANCGLQFVANNNLMVAPNAPSQQPFWNSYDFPCPWQLSGQKNVFYNSNIPSTPPPGAGTVNGDSSCVISVSYGVGTPCLTNNITTDPLFVSASTGDFHLQSSSPAKSGGMVTYPTRDFYGVPRGLNGGYSLGAFEAASAAATTVTSIYDINGDGVVDQNDVLAAIAQVVQGPCSNADVNHDGVCNILDVQLIINAILTGKGN